MSRSRSPAGTDRPEPGDNEYEEFIRLYDAILKRFQPEVLVNYGSSRLSHEVRSCARSQGVAVVFPLHNCNDDARGPFTPTNAVIVPSQFAADHYRKVLGLDCTVLSNLVEFSRIRAAEPRPALT